MSEIRLQPIDPKLDREMLVNDLRGILDDIASQGGGTLPISVYFYDRDQGCAQDCQPRLSGIKLGFNEDFQKAEVQIRVD
jgi:hypothetical protein